MKMKPDCKFISFSFRNPTTSKIRASIRNKISYSASSGEPERFRSAREDQALALQLRHRRQPTPFVAGPAAADEDESRAPSKKRVFIGYSTAALRSSYVRCNEVGSLLHTHPPYSWYYSMCL